MSDKSSVPAPGPERNAISDHSLKDDIEQIYMCAEDYKSLDAQSKKMIMSFIIGGQSLDFYYGGWVALFQVFTMAHIANNQLQDSIRPVVCGYAHKIISLVNESVRK